MNEYLLCEYSDRSKYLSLLPKELVIHIISYLDYASKWSFSRTSKINLIYDNSVFKNSNLLNICAMKNYHSLLICLLENNFKPGDCFTRLLFEYVDLSVIKNLILKGYYPDESAYLGAVKSGNSLTVEKIIYLVSEGISTNNEDIFTVACKNGTTEILEYLYNNKFPVNELKSYRAGASNLSVCKWLVEKFGTDYVWAITKTSKNVETIKLAIDHNAEPCYYDIEIFLYYLQKRHVTRRKLVSIIQKLFLTVYPSLDNLRIIVEEIVKITGITCDLLSLSCFDLLDHIRKTLHEFEFTSLFHMCIKNCDLELIKWCATHYLNRIRDSDEIPTFDIKVLQILYESGYIKQFHVYHFMPDNISCESLEFISKHNIIPSPKLLKGSLTRYGHKFEQNLVGSFFQRYVLLKLPWTNEIYNSLCSLKNIKCLNWLINYSKMQNDLEPTHRLTSDNFAFACMSDDITIIDLMLREKCPVTYTVANRLVQFHKVDALFWFIKKFRVKYCNKNCSHVCNMAAAYDNLSLLKTLKAKGYKWSTTTSTNAIKYASLPTIQWLLANGCPYTINDELLATLTQNGKHEVLIWLNENNYK
jgi:hypothetical protein